MVSTFQLLQTASDLSGVPVNVIKGRSRARRPVLVRQVLMVVVCDNLWYGREEAGRVIARHHTLVTKSLPVARFGIKNSARMRDLYAKLAKELNLEVCDEVAEA